MTKPMKLLPLPKFHVSKGCDRTEAQIYYANHVLERRAYQIEYGTRCRRADKSERLLWEFGITLDDYERMHKEQGDACKLCGAQRKRLLIDFDGTVRGLLCYSCLEAIKRLPETLAAVARIQAYLENRNE